jgi:hypothetical protein
VSARPDRVLLLFLDGVGIGENDARTNPLVRARLSTLRGLLGGALPLLGEVDGPREAPGGAWMVPVDATLGVPGLPQSGTGQTTLLTGTNAAERIGRHFGPWVPTALRPLLRRDNLLSRARAAGRSAAFANAYPAAYTGERRPAGPPLAARGAGVLTRHEAALRAGEAVTSELTNDAWRAHLDPDAPAVTPRRAGEILGRVCAQAELTLFAHYATDLAGHRREMGPAVEALERVDDFLAGVLDTLPADGLLVVTSDHGNLEDVRAGHTRNPVPVVAVGPGSRRLATTVRSLTDVTPAILELLDVRPSAGAGDVRTDSEP